MVRHRFARAVVLAAALCSLGAAAAPPAAATPPPDPQSVVVRVPAPTGTDTPTAPVEDCPVLRREDFVYDVASAGATTAVIDDWTAPTRLSVADAPTQVTITLRDGIDLPDTVTCRYPFTLASYRTSGATWAGAGSALPVGRSSGAIEHGSTRLTLVVPLDGCFAQVELYTGEARYEAETAPSYPRPVPPDVAVATWNGDRDCTGPGVVAGLAVVSVPPCPDDSSLTWLVVNPNLRAVETVLATEGPSEPWTGAVVAAPGSTPVVVARGAATPDAVVATWVDGAGVSRSVRSALAPSLQPGTPEHTARCVDPATPGVTVLKTASPPSGESVRPGESLTWTVTVVNDGDVALSAVEVIDVAPAYVTITDAAGADVSAAGDRLSWRVDLPAGSRAVLRYSGTVAVTAPVGAEVVNTAVVPLGGQSHTTSHPVAAAAAAPTAVPAGASPAAPRLIGSLPFTGADLRAAVVVAAVGLAGGTLLMVLARRRRPPLPGDPQAA